MVHSNVKRTQEEAKQESMKMGVELLGEYKGLNTKVSFLCPKCNTPFETTPKMVFNGHTKSCGCGKKSSWKIAVEKRSEKYKGKGEPIIELHNKGLNHVQIADKLNLTISTVKYWLHKNNIRGKTSNSNKDHYNWKGYGDISANFFYHIKHSADLRKIPFDIKIEDIWKLFEKQGGKCAISGLEIKFLGKNRKDRTASLDRIDNNKSYTIDNVQWTHKIVNIMRGKLTVDEFIQFCNIISNFNKERCIIIQDQDSNLGKLESKD